MILVVSCLITIYYSKKISSPIVRLAQEIDKIEKLELAKELLENGDFKSIADLSDALGYSKTAYFSSIYKKHFGVFPNSI